VSPEPTYLLYQAFACLLLVVGTFIVLMIAYTADQKINERDERDK
jgi:hypothetical protein